MTRALVTHRLAATGQARVPTTFDLLKNPTLVFHFPSAFISTPASGSDLFDHSIANSNMASPWLDHL